MFFAGSNRVRLAGLEDSVSGVGVGLVMLERGELGQAWRGVRPAYQAKRSSLHISLFGVERIPEETWSGREMVRIKRWTVEVVREKRRKGGDGRISPRRRSI